METEEDKPLPAAEDAGHDDPEAAAAAEKAAVNVATKIDVHAMPIRQYLETKTVDVLSKYTLVSDKLRNRHLQSLYTVLYYSFSSVFQYWLPGTTRVAPISTVVSCG